MGKISVQQILKETSESVTNGHSIEQLEKFKEMIKEVNDKKDKEALKYAIKIIEEVIKLKKNKKKLFLSGLYISALLVVAVFLIGNVSAMETRIGEYGYPQIWNMSGGIILVDGLEAREIMVSDTLNLSGGLNVSGKSNFTENVTFSQNVNILGTLYGGSPVKIGGGMNITTGHVYISAGNLHIDGDLIHDMGDVSFSGGSFSVDGNIDALGLKNSLGDLKIQPDVRGDVLLFGDTQVGDGDEGKRFYVHRKAPEGNDYMRFYIGSNQRGYIHGSPPNGIYIQGQTEIGLNSVTEDIVLQTGDNAGGKKVYFKDGDNTDVASIDSNGNAWFDGNVGIGVSNPSQPLMIMGNGGTGQVGITQNQVGGLYTMELTTQDLEGNQATRLLFRGNSNTSDIEFYNGGSGGEEVIMFIEGSNGFVGIGTNSPNQQLHVLVNGSSSYSNSNDRGILITDLYGPRVIFEDSGEGVDDKVMSIKYENENLVFGSLNDEGSSWNVENILAINRDGFVGIGTLTPGLPLEVRSADDNQGFFFDSRAQAQGVGGGIAFGGKYSDAGGEAMAGRIGTQKTNGISGDVSFDMVFQTQDWEGSITERMILTGDGKVGIGEENPTKTLDVGGDVHISGELETDNGIIIGGNIQVSGLVDGRDIATDGTKLDGIETSAEVSTKEFFLPAGSGIVDNNAVHEDEAIVLPDGVTFARAYFTFHLPSDFSSMAAGYPKIVLMPGVGGGGNVRIQFNTQSGGVGEQLGVRQDSISEYTKAVSSTSNIIIEEDISAAFNDLSLVASDSAQVYVQRDSDDSLDTLSGDLNVVGVIVKYN